MRAIGIHEFGGRDKLQLLELPEPKVPPDAVKIRVRAAGVNPVDWKLREGRLEGRFPHVFPVVPGWDAAGVVEEVGPDVVEFATGDEVFAYCRKHFVGEGTYAEYISVPATFVARKPERFSYEQAGATPLAGLTAYQALFRRAGLVAGERVLVPAAAGGVGSFAVQLATDAGAEVIGIAERAEPAARARARRTRGDRPLARRGRGRPRDRAGGSRRRVRDLSGRAARRAQCATEAASSRSCSRLRIASEVSYRRMCSCAPTETCSKS